MSMSLKQKPTKFIKQWIIWALLIAFSWPYLYKSGVILDFYINRDKIAKENCIQKNIPNNCCKGSCQLNQSLAKVNLHDTPSEKPLIIVLENFLLEYFHFQSLSIPQLGSELLGHFYQMPKLHNNSTSIEHPPQVC